MALHLCFTVSLSQLIMMYCKAECFENNTTPTFVFPNTSVGLTVACIRVLGYFKYSTLPLIGRPKAKVTVYHELCP